MPRLLEMSEHRILALTSSPERANKKELVEVVNYWTRECCIEAARRVAVEDRVKLLNTSIRSLLCLLPKRSLKARSKIASIVAALSGCNESTTSGPPAIPKRKRSRSS